MKKIAAAALCLALTAGMAVPCRGAAAGPEIAAPSAALMTLDGELLLEKDARARREPASVTKVMTMLLVCEAVDEGRLSLSDTVTASAHAAAMGGSQIWLEEGERMTAEEMLKCVAVASANDCAVALGEHLAGSEESFVELMNRRAAELGMEDTHFVNACGLTAEGHLTSARDVGLMSAALLREHPWISEYSLIWQDTVRNGAFGLDNTNKMIRSYPGLTGLKTGFTSSAGYCISASAEREGLHLIAVILGGETKESRTADASSLLNWGFANYAAVTLGPDRPLEPVPVILGDRERVECRLAAERPLVLPREWLNGLEKSVELAPSLTAPVEEGQQIGTLRVTREGALVAEIPIAAAQSTARLTLWQIFFCAMRAVVMKF